MNFTHGPTKSFAVTPQKPQCSSEGRGKCQNAEETYYSVNSFSVEMKLTEILNKIFDDKRYMITLVIVWFIVCAIGFSTVGLFSSEFMRFGPNDTLTYLTIKIDTWARYIFILSFTVISTCINDLA